ncbi:hypothetical protein [Paenibacillus pini]|uniref:Uncharacterized protein n=1 Tax=Paenibacillus pini JCM 16418 TaxID=1236976 RepID=W7YF90_9BACL|nr:hypothetical protein [Paenibacillus pini]GAF09585.1 hypothetical protein JCM16418_3730 [Paenibacillus pini JCM 16418]
MFEEINERMIQLKENRRNQERWTQRLEELDRELKQLEGEADTWKARLHKEEKDVERLTSASLTGLLFSLIGRKEEKLEHEQLEVLEAKAKYDAAIRSLEDVRAQRDDMLRLLQTVRYADVEYQQVFRDKEQMLLRGNRELVDLSERRASLTVQMKEMKEAVQAGKVVLSDLEYAEDSYILLRAGG